MFQLFIPNGETMCLLMCHLTRNKLVFEWFMYSLYQILNDICIYRKAIIYPSSFNDIITFQFYGKWL